MKRLLKSLIIIIVCTAFFACKSKMEYHTFNLSNDCYASSVFKIPITVASNNEETINFSTFEMMKNYNQIVNESNENRCDNVYNLPLDEYKNNCLNVIVDTLAQVSIFKKNYDELSGCSKEYLEIENDTDTVKIAALLVYIYNPMNKNAYIDVTMHNVYAIQEAKNENGEWKPIEIADFGDWCTSQTNRDLIIKPQQYLKLKTIKYSGYFETEMRLKVKIYDNVYYSNIYMGTINKSQFNMCSFMQNIPYNNSLFLNN